MSQWLIILFHSLLDQFWFWLHNPELVEKLGCYTFFPKNFRVLDYASRLHQADLSKSCKHWDIFLSHCRCQWHTNQQALEETVPSKTRTLPCSQKSQEWCISALAPSFHEPTSSCVQCGEAHPSPTWSHWRSLSTPPSLTRDDRWERRVDCWRDLG